jgi:hypothetical protein
METHMTIRPPGLLQDPEALRLAWAALLAQNQHLHGPEAAAQLGVPEAALLASRVGFGATALQPDLANLLAPARQWGKVLLAARNQLGVALLIMDDPHITAGTDAVVMRTDQHLARVALDGVDRCYLFEERDGHGHTVSLNWFDGHGHVIGRLFLMSKSGREVAMPFLQQQALPMQEQTWVPGGLPLPAVLALEEPSEGVVHRLTCAGTPLSAWAESAVLACGAATLMSVTWQGPGLAVRYWGPLAKGTRTPGAVHASDAACKLHLRMATCDRVLRRDDPDGGVALVLEDGNGGSLGLRAGASPAESRTWLDRWQATAPVQAHLTQEH